jgi:CubicO group peptidase (beta-lactamase class C family)
MFHIASISKFETTLGTMKMVEQGLRGAITAP